MTEDPKNPIEADVTPHIDEESVHDLGEIGDVDVEAYKHDELLESLPGGKFPEVEQKLDELRATVYKTIAANNQAGANYMESLKAGDPNAIRERQLKFRLGAIAYEKWKREGGKLPENPEDDKFIKVS